MNVLITGGSRGLGLNIVNLFLENGWNVYNVSRTRPDITSYNFHHLSFDLSNVEMVKQKIFKEFITNKTPIHAVIHNAAIAYDDIVTNAKIAPLKSMFDVNVFSPIMMNREVIRNMIFNRISGSIIFVSSISSMTGYKGLSMYAATKGALESHSKNISREWGTRGIRSNCVVPGFMETEMSQGLTSEQKQRIYNRNSLKKETDVKSVASLVYFLASEESNSITGQNINVDCGTT
jgi:3-oxoacyl-[acyl-carrier protein] reductase